jgi:hypothetical protein
MSNEERDIEFLLETHIDMLEEISALVSYAMAYQRIVHIMAKAMELSALGRQEEASQAMTAVNTYLTRISALAPNSLVHAMNKANGEPPVVH